MTGEFAALTAALIWAIASFIYIHIGKLLAPLTLNLVKSTIAIALVLLTLLIQGNTSPNIDATGLGLLLASGAIGIGFGDTVFFESLNCIGARRALLMESLAPPLTAIFALIFLHEQLQLIAWLGIVLTVGGVSWVVAERAPDAVQGAFRPLRGVGFGLLAALAQASGSVMSRAALAETTVDPLWSTLIRLGAGVVALLLWLAVQRHPWQSFKPLQSGRLILVLIGASFVSTYLAVWLQQTAIKYTAAGIAQALSATSPLFVIPIALLMRQKVSIREILGVVVALSGVWLLFDLR